jgi:hypothetical protein
VNLSQAKVTLVIRMVNPRRARQDATSDALGAGSPQISTMVDKSGRFDDFRPHSFAQVEGGD